MLQVPNQIYKANVFRSVMERIYRLQFDKSNENFRFVVKSNGTWHNTDNNSVK